MRVFKCSDLVHNVARIFWGDVAKGGIISERGRGGQCVPLAVRSKLVVCCVLLLESFCLSCGQM